jgi:urea carboxylase
VEKGDALVIMEAMKMEIAVVAETSGTVVAIHGTAGSGARAGDLLLALRPAVPA